MTTSVLAPVHSGCNTKLYDFPAIRASNPLIPFLEGRGVHLQKCGNYYVGKCPIHRERNGMAFAVWPDEARWRCFGKCGCRGDVVDLLAHLEGISNPEAAARLSQGTSLLPASPVIWAPAPKVATPPYELTQKDLDRIGLASHRLASDPDLVERLCKRRPEWTPEAVRGAALDGVLGYEDNCVFGDLRGPAALFVYPHGIKARWKDVTNSDGSTDKQIRWVRGAAHAHCWRQNLMLPHHEVVFITEGESDALTALSWGVEDCGVSLVVALAGARILPNPEPFRGRVVFVIPDADVAGKDCAAKLQRLFHGIAHKVYVISLEVVARGI
jgi:hypothetical protein